MEEINDIIKEEGDKLAEERAKLTAFAESIKTGLRLFREIDEKIHAFIKGSSELMECSECGCLCGGKVRH